MYCELDIFLGGGGGGGGGISVFTIMSTSDTEFNLN